MCEGFRGSLPVAGSFIFEVDQNLSAFVGQKLSVYFALVFLPEHGQTIFVAQSEPRGFQCCATDHGEARFLSRRHGHLGKGCTATLSKYQNGAAWFNKQTEGKRLAFNKVRKDRAPAATDEAL